MPGLTELLLDPISISVFVLFGALIVAEALFPARPLPHSPSWQLRGLAAFFLYFLLSSYLPLIWGETLAKWQVFDLTGLGKWGGALAGLLVYEAGVYLWHRSLHASDFLWRYFHQFHHSAERIDTFGAFWFSPLDMLGWTALSSLCLTVIIGITPEAAVLVLYATTFLGIFQHSNLRTPPWLGYIMQRPESHSHHHGRGIHARNYSDLPVFDWLFGTLNNPKDFAPANGFYNGASLRIGSLLAGRDLTRPEAAKADAFAAEYQPPV